MLTIKQLCEKYPYLCPSTVYLWVEQRQLPHYRLGGKGRRGRIVVDEADFAAFLASRKVDAGQLRPEFKFNHAR
ncbi:MAG: helix-turn-helix domain-containing protein [Planctomycetia bacterium]|nr:helix-turn-helix domain-containing protein [Planctomycetia bacterium]